MATPRIAGTTQPSWYCCKGSIASAASSQPMEPPKTATKLEMQVAKDAMPTSREVYTSLVFSASTMAITGGSSEKMVLYTAQV